MNDIDTWALRRERFDPAQQVLDASLFALGNGFIGLRGVLDEGPVAGEHDGCYLNGFYDSTAIHHPETAFGLAGTNQFMLNVPNGRRLEIWLDDERLDLRQGKVRSWEQVIDFREGVLRRRLEWEAPSGRVLRLVSERLACLRRQTVWAARTRVEPLNFGGTIGLVLSLDGHVAPLAAGNDPRIGSHVKEPPLVLVSCSHGEAALRQRHHTRHSGLHLVSVLAWGVNAPAGPGAIVQAPEPPPDMPLQSCLRHRISVALAAGQAVELERFGTYQTSIDLAEADLETLAADTIAAAREAGFDGLLREQAHYLQEFWDRADLVVEGDDSLQQGLRFNAWHLLQSAGRDGRTNIAAKGLTGEGYEGHTFWDTEIYVLPFFAATRPEIARALLEYRYRHLGSARARALDLAVGRGAVYPWRTIAGVECSAYFLAGTAQAHLNADIAHAVQLYWTATGDDAFMLSYGAELTLETARLWPAIGHHDPRRDNAFCIHGVTGPDEYTALVDNNWFTNKMAQRHLRFALRVLDWLKDDHPGRYAELLHELQIDEAETAAWQRAADTMWLPVDERLGVHPQDDTFLHKPRWDFDGPGRYQRPLLLYYHPLVIYRHQVSKQADVVLGLLLAGEDIDPATKRRDFDYYEGVTTHDSSLSYCVFGVIAAELGLAEKALDYFHRTARLDLDNLHGNSAHGVHIAAMAGSWMGLAQGFGGLRWIGGRPSFKPLLPPGWQRFAFRLMVRGAQIELSVSAGRAHYRLLRGREAEFLHDGQRQWLSPDQPELTLPLRAPLAQPTLPPPVQAPVAPLAPSAAA
jgi:alpha,alpha-trehalose phosphorylase